MRRTVPERAGRSPFDRIAHMVTTAGAPMRDNRRPMYRVVLVDDYADLRSLLTRFLERSGSFTVAASCENARDGIDAARTEQPDLVLVDLGLPDMNGLDALVPLREAAPDARIVVLSGSEPSSAQRMALDLGADAYLDKSSGGDQLPGMLLDIMRD
jgi:DNA-binding NarL/FixJ family response regulator